jgi:hypothetical protein
LVNSRGNYYSVWILVLQDWFVMVVSNSSCDGHVVLM